MTAHCYRIHLLQSHCSLHLLRNLMCMSPSGQRDESVLPSEASLEDLQVCVCVHAARDLEDLFAPFLPALITFCLQLLFISKIDCRLTVSSFQGLVSSSAAVNYYVVTMSQHLAPHSRQCSVRIWQGSSQPKLGADHSWAAKHTLSLRTECAVHIENIYETCGQIRYCKQYV